MLPRGWGVAYYRWDRDEAVCYPVPFNKLIGWGRRIYGWLRSTKPDRIADLTAKSRRMEWRNGVESGRRQHRDDVEIAFHELARRIRDKGGQEGFDKQTADTLRQWVLDVQAQLWELMK